MTERKKNLKRGSHSTGTAEPCRTGNPIVNKYLRAVGFTKLPRRSELQNIIAEGLKDPDYRAYTADDEEDDILLGQFDIALNANPGRTSNELTSEVCADDPEELTRTLIDRLFAAGENISESANSDENRYQIGLSVCGQFDEKDEFYPDYCYPYLNSSVISSTEELTVEPRVDNDTFAGVCDDLRVGAALIFRLRNAVEYRRNLHTSFLPLEHASVTLTALSLEGSIMLPIYKSPDDLCRKKNTEIKRRRLLNAARSGDEKAMHNLTEADMETWSNVLSQIQVDDVFTLVESYFMPYGAECELYSVMGDITGCETLTNRLTGEEICVLQIESNGLPVAIAINREDLVGEPGIGRRFKGVVWLQGHINFPIAKDLSTPGEATDRENPEK